MQTIATKNQHRPKFHFTAKSGWINDPNGLLYHEGEYHLFYQHHPHSTVWGPMHWGHAVSRDLLHWDELPIAMAPDELGLIFSGSAVIDRNNTAGFGENVMVAVFTHAAKDAQMQSLAYSHDRGRTWTKYAHNPVLRAPENAKDFRDPKVFWHDTGTQAHWVMALAVAKEIWFYSSTNLKEWTLSSRFGADFGSHAGVWECPELIQLDVENSAHKCWVLVVSVGNGAPAGGSGVQYFVGQFDGFTFTSHDSPERIRWADFGADFYAPQAWNDAPDGRKLWLGWMNNWSYGNQIPDDGGWRGAMTVPRELVLLREGADDVVLVQQPVRELMQRHNINQRWGRFAIHTQTRVLSETPPAVQDLRINFCVDDATTAPFFGITLGDVVVGYDRVAQTLSVKRDDAGLNIHGFAATHLAALAPRNGLVSLRVLADANSVEVFADGGRLVMTAQIFPALTHTRLAVFADNGSVIVDSVEVFGW